MTELNKTSDAELIELLEFAEAKKSEHDSIIKKLKNEIATRKQPEIDRAYSAKDEPYGDVSIEVSGKVLKFTRPKKVDWNQTRLAELAKQIADDGADPKEYVDVEYNVPEKRWSVWGSNIRSHFEDARTVTPGNLSIKIVEKKE